MLLINLFLILILNYNNIIQLSKIYIYIFFFITFDIYFYQKIQFL